MDTGIFMNSRVCSCGLFFSFGQLTNLSFPVQFNYQNSILSFLFPLISLIFSLQPLHRPHLLHHPVHHQHTIHLAHWTITFPCHKQRILIWHFKFRKLMEYKVIIFIIHCLYINVILNPSSCMSFYPLSSTLILWGKNI